MQYCCCSFKNCNKEGNNEVEIKFVKSIGYFCDLHLKKMGNDVIKLESGLIVQS